MDRESLNEKEIDLAVEQLLPLMADKIEGYQVHNEAFKSLIRAKVTIEFHFHLEEIDSDKVQVLLYELKRVFADVETLEELAEEHTHN